MVFELKQEITYAYLETTNYCNLDCSFCNRKDVIDKLQHMPILKWKKLLNGIKHHPIKEVKLMGMGEPFFHPQFDETCKIFKEIFPECFLIVATNCQYDISPNKRMREVFQNALKYIDMLYFSIDGFEDNYERDRSPAKWSKLLDFLTDFKTINRYDCNVVVNYVVNAYNIDDIEKIDNLRKENNLGKLRLNIAQIWDEEIKMEDDIRTSGYTTKQLNYLKNNWGNNIMGKSKWDFSDCFWVKNGLYATVEGHVKMCCMNTGATSFGNLFENTIDEIRLTDEYQKVKGGCLTNNPTNHCKKCSYNELKPILNRLGVNN